MENETMVTCFTCKGRGLVQESPTARGLITCPICNGEGKVTKETYSYNARRGVWAKIIKHTREHINNPIEKDVFYFTYREVVLLRYALHLLNKMFYDGSDLHAILDDLQRKARTASKQYKKQLAGNGGEK